MIDSNILNASSECYNVNSLGMIGFLNLNWYFLLLEIFPWYASDICVSMFF